LSLIDSNNYRFNNQSKSVLFYNENGKLKEEITINNVGGNFFSDSWDGTFIEFIGYLLRKSFSGRKLIKFSK
jgi:hypothetical protein